MCSRNLNLNIIIMARLIKIKSKGPLAAKASVSTAKATSTKKVSTITTVTPAGNIKGRNAKNIPGTALVVYNRYNPQTGAIAYTVTGDVNQRAKDSARAQFAKANNVPFNETNLCTASHYRKNIWGK